MIKQLSFLKLSVVFLLTLLACTASATTFKVSNLLNTGPGSLRQAITDANAGGAGGHNINFSVSGVIPLASNLPVISNNHITIDGSGQTITVSANGGDIARHIFRGNAGADFLTVRNLDIKNTGLEAFHLDGGPTDVTIENIRWYNEFGNYYNQGIFFVGNALNLTVRNVIAEDPQNYNAVIEITGTATNLMVDNLTFDNTLSYHYSTEVIRIGGAATNCTFQNCNWNLDNGLSSNDGDYEIYFYSARAEANGVEYVQFNGITSFSTFGAGSFVNQPDGSVLPVELIHFSANPVNNEYIQLDWANATEINNDGFEVQRSLNGIDFQEISWVEGNGNSSSIIEYRLNDENISTNTYYYRLKQVNFDGEYSYSNIVSAYIKSGSGNVFDIRLQPNPSLGFGKVGIHSPISQEAHISIFNTIGVEVLSEDIKLDVGSTELDFHEYQSVPGIYNLVLYRSDEKPVLLKWVIRAE
jgi:hypothetical protein